MRPTTSIYNRARRRQPTPQNFFRPSLILLGAVMGVTLGLLYGLWLDPVKLTEATPAMLRPDAKDHYVSLIASAYVQDKNLDRAKQRLAILGDPARAVINTAQRLVAQSKDPGATVTLATLLVSGGATPTPPATALTAVTPVNRTVTPTIRVSPSTTPQLLITATTLPIAAEFKLISNEKYCNDDERKPFIIVDVNDENKKPLAGVRVTVKWADGQDGFVTGLKPEISVGYGDFLMQVGTAYSVQVGQTSIANGLTSSTCIAKPNVPYAGAVRLVVQRGR